MEDKGAVVVSRRWLKATLIVGGVLFAWLLLRWELIGIHPIFLFFTFFIQLGLGGLFLLIALFSLGHYAYKAYKVGWAAGRYAMVVLIFGIAVAVFPYSQVMLETDFRWYLTDREKVVAMVAAGDPALVKEKGFMMDTFRSRETYSLPDGYKRLSKGGGDIVVQREAGRTKIFFYTFRGILDNFSGFVYVSDDSTVHKDDFNGDFKQVLRLRENWYFAASW